MTATEQNNLEHIMDLLQRGLITSDQANVMKVRFNRLLVVTKLRSEVRRALNAAVKTGELSHMKRDGIKPEVYYHPTFEYLAIAARNEAIRAAARALKATCV